MGPLLEDEERSGLERAGRARQHRPGGRWHWGGSLSQRASVARRLPQAVFKISSYSHGGGAVWDRANYISREGELDVETDDGLQLENLAELDTLVSRWAGETAGRKGGRLAMNAVVSFPAGVDHEQATEAARQFLSAAFEDNHEYFFAAHDDTANFHIHVVVKCQGRDGTKLSIGPPELGALRELFAEKAAEHGIELDASPRWARGLDRETPAPAAVAGIERRGDVPRWNREARAALAQARAEENPQPPAADRSERERLEYARAAALVVENMGQLTDDTRRAQAVGLAADLALYAEQMPGQRDPEQDPVRALTRSTERALRAEINAISEPALKRAAIEHRARLSAALPPQRGREADTRSDKGMPVALPPQRGRELDAPAPERDTPERPDQTPPDSAAVPAEQEPRRPPPSAPTPDPPPVKNTPPEIEPPPAPVAVPPTPQLTAWETVKARVGAWFSRDPAPEAPPAPPAAQGAPERPVAGPQSPPPASDPVPAAERTPTHEEARAAYKEVLEHQEEIKAAIAEMPDPAEREKAERLLATVQRDAAARQQERQQQQERERGRDDGWER